MRLRNEPSRVPRGTRRRWTAIGVLGVAAASLALGASPGAQAQEPEHPSSAFGGYTTAARANGLQLTYNVENVFPLPAPLFQASVPEAAVTLQSGPTTTALGSVAYPGNVLASLPALVAQASPEAAPFVPPYPVLSRAEHPAGPPEARQDIATASSTARANDTFAEAITTMGGGDLPPFVRIGAITTSARTGFVDGQIESRSRIELAGVDLLFGLLHIESIVTDLVATTDGEGAASDGGTTVAGITFLGLPVEIGPDGLLVGTPSGPGEPGPLTPLEEGLGELAPALGDALGGAADALNPVLQQILGTTNATINDLLAATGISIRTFEPFESVDGASAERTANGLVIDINYDGSGDNPLAQLLAAIPSDQLPGEGIPGFPVNTSPQALVNLLKETHVTGLALAYGNVSVNASPAFEFEPPAFTPGSVGSPGVRTGQIPRTTPGFQTPAPQLPPAPGDEGTGAADGTPAGAVGTGAAGAAVVLALLTSPLWAIGSRSLADNTLCVAGSSCPAGLDTPPNGR